MEMTREAEGEGRVGDNCYREERQGNEMNGNGGLGNIKDGQSGNNKQRREECMYSMYVRGW